MALQWWLVFAFATFAKADYDCLCNYNVELEVHSAMNDSSTRLGSLYEFDCSEFLKAIRMDPGWGAIAYQHKVGYVRTGPNTDTQTCQGSPLGSDKVSVTNVPTTTTTPATLAPNTITTTSPTTTTVATSTPTTTVTTTPTTVTTTPLSTTTTTTPLSTTTTTPTTTTTTTTTRATDPTTRTTTSLTTTPVTSAPTTTTTMQTGIISGQTNLCPVALRSFTAKDHGTLAQYDKSCYELISHRTSWSRAELDCKTKGAHLVQINTKGEQDFMYNLIKTHYNHDTWIGLHDLQHEGHYEWATGEPVVYTNWHSAKPPQHSQQDCVYLDPHNGGYWDDTACSSDHHHPYICQYEIDANAIVHGTVSPHGDAAVTSIAVAPKNYEGGISTVSNVSETQGNTHLCPSTVVHHATNYHGVLGQYGQSCYELLPRYHVSWSHGERLCQQEGGHLAHISNADEQSFIQEFMTKHLPKNGAWIGLNDKGREGHFTWSSGAPLTYTNWVKAHNGILDSPRREDCALFLPYANGHWNDLHCGSTGSPADGDYGETHPILCQFGIRHGSAVIG